MDGRTAPTRTRRVTRTSAPFHWRVVPWMDERPRHGQGGSRGPRLPSIGGWSRGRLAGRPAGFREFARKQRTHAGKRPETTGRQAGPYRPGPRVLFGGLSPVVVDGHGQGCHEGLGSLPLEGGPVALQAGELGERARRRETGRSAGRLWLAARGSRRTNERRCWWWEERQGWRRAHVLHACTPGYARKT